MPMLNEQYDVAILGGGLAGLAAAIRLRKSGCSVVLFEKESYPFHKVCGEYISMESWNYLEQLGIPLKQLELPIIKELILTAPNGNAFHTTLPLGGFGISRYRLDKLLADIARDAGVHLLEETRVEEVEYDGGFLIHFTSRVRSEKKISARACCGAFGKRSNLDIKWGRSFLHAQDKRLDNYVGIKYHIRTQWPASRIGLHNFENGYCGLSAIEEDTYCLCYLTRSSNLKQCGNHIGNMEKEVLYKNPHLKKIFTESEFVAGFPIVISQINFHKRTQVEEHVLMLGDAAGMITPLCGNGMSMALHAAKLASDLIPQFLSDRLSQEALESRYASAWQKEFSARMRTGRLLQRFFGNTALSNLFVQTFKTFPFLARPVVKMTHGRPY